MQEIIGTNSNKEKKVFMKVIGLTGGMGTGKSTVSEYIAQKGIKIIDADKIARMVTEKGSDTLMLLVKAFGNSILYEDGSLNRKALAKLAFASDKGKKTLDHITHDAIKDEIYSQVLRAERAGEKVLVIDAPLLIEANLYLLCDTVWCVCADMNVRIERIKKRDDIPEEMILARIEKQLSDEVRNAYSDEIIDNSAGKEELYERVEQLMKKYV